MRIALFVVAVAAIAAAVALWQLPDPAPAPVDTIDDSDRPSTASPVLANSVAREPLVAAVDADPATFEEFVDRLVDLAFAAHERGDEDSRDLQREADAVWEELHAKIRHPDDRALLYLGELLIEGESGRNEARRRICMRVIAHGLAVREREFRASGRREALDTLVTQLLTGVAAEAQWATAFAAMLIDRPYLGLAHEAAVLDLVAAVPDEPRLAPFAGDLLLTLWRNLQTTGARTSDELAGLALLFKDDANPSRRAAALRHLLTAKAGRFRELVVQDVLRTRNAELARLVATTAANELPPEAALSILTRVTPIAGVSALGAFMSLGLRDPGLLQQAYQRQLGTASDPALRSRLVSGFGFAGTPEGLELARTAFELDPDPAVRSSAMFVLTASAGSALGERTLMAALDDPRLGRDPIHLGEIALALENLATADQVNTVDRVAQRLLGRKELLPADRQRLESLLDRVLPGRAQAR